MFNLNVIWHSDFLIAWQLFYGERAKSLKKFFLQLWKRNFVDSIEISGNRYASINFHWKKLKHPTYLFFQIVITADL